MFSENISLKYLREGISQTKTTLKITSQVKIKLSQRQVGNQGHWQMSEAAK